MSIRFFIVTLGCKVNQYESRALAESWEAAGHTAVAGPHEAELVLVNSCAVTAKAVAEVRNTVRRMTRFAPQAKIVLTGCAAQVQKEELATLSGVHAIIPQPHKGHLVALGPEALLQQTAHQNQLSPGGEEHLTVLSPLSGHLPEVTVPETRTPHFPPFHISGYDRTRAVVKMQDGCSHRCTYCIVPLARGRSCSRPLAETMQEIERLLAAGFREIGLNGVNLRQYGPDLDPPHDFWDALAALEDRFAPEWAGRARFRISSLEPGQLNDKALQVLGNSKLVAPHLHLSLQSGSNGVLKRMGRGHYNPKTVVSFMEALATARPLLGLGADILTGFPGETEDEYAETLALCEALPFSYAHVFPYSRRPGTAAAAMLGQLPQKMKKERAAGLRTLVAAKQQKFLQRLLALPLVSVAVEGRHFTIGDDGAGTLEALQLQTEHIPNRTGPSKTNDSRAVSDAEENATLADGAKATSHTAPHGLNEYYVECRFATPVPPREDGTFVFARPVRVEGMQLVVEATAQ